MASVVSRRGIFEIPAFGCTIRIDGEINFLSVGSKNKYEDVVY